MNTPEKEESPYEVGEFVHQIDKYGRPIVGKVSHTWVRGGEIQVQYQPYLWDDLDKYKGRWTELDKLHKGKGTLITPKVETLEEFLEMKEIDRYVQEEYSQIDIDHIEEDFAGEDGVDWSRLPITKEDLPIKIGSLELTDVDHEKNFSTSVCVVSVGNRHFSYSISGNYNWTDVDISEIYNYEPKYDVQIANHEALIKLALDLREGKDTPKSKECLELMVTYILGDE